MTDTTQPPATGAAPPPSASTTPPVIVTLPNGALPDSAYSPPKPPERYYPDTVNELIPSGGYGRIWPYIGGHIDSAMGTQSELIGICDERGKIICDPVYNDVKLIERDGRELYAFVKYDMVTGDRYEDLYITTLAATDGSWAKTFDSVLWEEKSGYEYPTYPDDYWAYQWRDAVSYDYITARQDGKWGVLGWDGAVLLPFEYLEPVCFHEGLAAVLSNDGNSYSFIDINGKTVLGPFDAPPRPIDDWDYTGTPLPRLDKLIFFDGYAKFYDKGKFGIIDRGGKIVVPAVYDFITCMNGGIAMFAVYYDTPGPGMAGNKRFGVVNDAGAVIVKPTDYNYTYYMNPVNINGQAVLATSGGSGDVVASDGTKTPYTPPDNWQSITGNTVTFRDRELIFAGYTSVTSLPDGRFIAYNYDSDMWRLFDKDGKPLAPGRPGRSGYWSDAGLQFSLLFMDAPNNNSSYYPLFMVYDFDANLVSDGLYYAFKPIGGKYMVRGKTTAGLMNQDGSYVIEVSVTAYGVD